jgi:hypothetical protein
VVTNLPKVSSERTPGLCGQVVRVIEVIDFVYIFGIGEIVDRRISVNWGTLWTYVSFSRNSSKKHLPLFHLPMRRAPVKIFKSNEDKRPIYPHAPSNSLPWAGVRPLSRMGFLARKLLNSGTNCLNFLKTRNEPSLVHAGRVTLLSGSSPCSPMRITPGSIGSSLMPKTAYYLQIKQLTSRFLARVGFPESNDWRLR